MYRFIKKSLLVALICLIACQPVQAGLISWVQGLSPRTKAMTVFALSVACAAYAGYKIWGPQRPSQESRPTRPTLPPAGGNHRATTPPPASTPTYQSAAPASGIYQGPPRSVAVGNGYFRYYYPGGPVEGELQVRFYDKGQPFEEFSNFHPAPINIGGVTWPTSEHYFQAQKFTGSPVDDQSARAVRQRVVYDTMSTLKTPRESFEMAKTYVGDQRPDWEQMKELFMLHGVRAKFTTHRGLQQKLIDTGNARLVEATENDVYWGVNNSRDRKPVASRGKWYAYGQGMDRLGVILEHVRSELVNERRTGAYVPNNNLPPVQVRQWYV